MPIKNSCKTLRDGVLLYTGNALPTETYLLAEILEQYSVFWRAAKHILHANPTFKTMRGPQLLR